MEITPSTRLTSALAETMNHCGIGIDRSRARVPFSLLDQQAGDAEADGEEQEQSGLSGHECGAAVELLAGGFAGDERVVGPAGRRLLGELPAGRAGSLRRGPPAAVTAPAWNWSSTPSTTDSTMSTSSSAYPPRTASTVTGAPVLRRLSEPVGQEDRDGGATVVDAVAGGLLGRSGRR